MLADVVGSARGRVAVAIVVLIGLAGALAVVVLRYAPLQHVGDVTVRGDTPVVTINEWNETGAHIVRYAHGDDMTYTFTVHNTGPLGVTVTGVRLPPQRQRRLFQPVGAGVAAANGATAPEASFEPFHLAAGERRAIAVHGRFDNCEYYTERAIEVIDGHALELRVAGVPRTARLDFARPLLVRSPTIQRCDERTLDRSDNQRTEP